MNKCSTKEVMFQEMEREIFLNPTYKEK